MTAFHYMTHVIIIQRQEFKFTDYSRTHSQSSTLKTLLLDISTWLPHFLYIFLFILYFHDQIRQIYILGSNEHHFHYICITWKWRRHHHFHYVRIEYVQIAEQILYIYVQIDGCSYRLCTNDQNYSVQYGLGKLKCR